MTMITNSSSVPLLKIISTFGKDITSIEKNIKKKNINEERKSIIEETKEKTMGIL